MSAETKQPSLPLRRSALRSGIATGASILTVSAAAAIAGAYLAHKFGRDARDGRLSRGVRRVPRHRPRGAGLPARDRSRPDARIGGGAAAGGVLLLRVRAADARRARDAGHDRLRRPDRRSAHGQRCRPSAADIASSAVVWLVPAAFAQTLAALAASALAARDSYIVAAAAYALGAISGLVVFVAFSGSHGLVSLAWGLALNGALAAAFRSWRSCGTATSCGTRSGGVAIWPRLRKLVQAAAVPIAIQALYLIALRGASGLGEGSQTSLTYAYLFAATLVAATASSLSLISSAPLTRRGLDAESASAHVLHASWLSLDSDRRGSGRVHARRRAGRQLRARRRLRRRCRQRSRPPRRLPRAVGRRGRRVLGHVPAPVRPREDADPRASRGRRDRGRHSALVRHARAARPARARARARAGDVRGRSSR